MKTTFWFGIVCAAAIAAGCSTNRGGTTDPNETSSGGSLQQTGPEVTEPSLPQDPNAGPYMAPP
jgi:hypothetical protein